MKQAIWLGMLLFACSAQAQPISVTDDAGRQVQIAQPAQRIISLAPHATELVFAAGGGKKLVGVVSYSDFPEEAKRIQNIGDNRQWDMERIIALKPDLLVVWQHGNAERQVEELRRLKIPLYYSQPKTMAEIADSLEKLGQLIGTSGAAREAARQFRTELAQLQKQYAGKRPLRMFYQVWDKPLYTLNGQHIVSDAMRLCGAQNIFHQLSVLAPAVSTEAVLKENPDVIITGDQGEQSTGGIKIWRQYSALQAVKSGNLYEIDGALLSRAGPRMLQGARQLCQALEQARARQAKP
ncbi:cobalamin-binding protein [Massilia sp. W12]|uniref:cobalamin-binding protein n=1 Tax=Massilia sp. W12 TaxID=3126507 RepID=UPI0030D2A8C1